MECVTIILENALATPIGQAQTVLFNKYNAWTIAQETEYVILALECVHVTQIGRE